MFALRGAEPARARAAAPRARRYVDRSLEDDGIEVGQTLGFGPRAHPGEGRGVRRAAPTFNLQGAVWVDPDTWRGGARQRPRATLAPGAFQALLVTPEQGVAPVGARRRDRPSRPRRHRAHEAGRDPRAARREGPESIFTAIIGVTFVVAGLVVALFFALLTLERVGLFGVLKAIGASSRTLGRRAQPAGRADRDRRLRRGRRAHPRARRRSSRPRSRSTSSSAAP